MRTLIVPSFVLTALLLLSVAVAEAGSAAATAGGSARTRAAYAAVVPVDGTADHRARAAAPEQAGIPVPGAVGLALLAYFTLRLAWQPRDRA